MKNTAIDFYNNAEARAPRAETTVGNLIDAIRSGEYAQPVEKIRRLLAAGEKQTADAVKRALPAVSLSGTVNGGRARAVPEGRFSHSGLLQIDVDAKDNPGWTITRIREVLQADPHIAAGFVTPSGAGVKGIAKIPADPSTHLAAFHTAESHFRALGLTIDKACKDPVRLCFVSHDPDAWLSLDQHVAEFLPGNEHNAARLENDTAGQNDTKKTHNNNRIVIGEQSHRREITASDVRDMLALIPPRPDYDEWMKIASAVWDAIGEADGTAALLQWSPEEHPGEYARKYQHRLTNVHVGTLIMAAKSNGWAPPQPSTIPRKNAAIKRTTDDDTGDTAAHIPAHILPVPAGEIGHDLAARHIFALIAPANRLFSRGGAVHEIIRDNADACSLAPVTGKRFVSLVESFGARVMRREAREDGTLRWRAATFPVASAEIALLSNGAREHLPRIRQLINSPIIVPAPGGSAVLQQGFHPHAGGTYVTSNTTVPIVPLPQAVEMLLTVLADFDFSSGGDASRAVASLISPALKFGGWIEDDFPLDLSEADESQSGKTYRFRLIHAIYREKTTAIANQNGGVGSLDENISGALLRGNPFIVLDNLRGRMDSQIMEAAIRGVGQVRARAFRASADVDCSPFLWQISTNGAGLTTDMANRAIVTRVRKRTMGRPYQTFPAGDIFAHVSANQPQFLGAVMAVVRDWALQGCPRTSEDRHDFSAWCRVMDWIVQNIFCLPPLLDGHREEQQRTANKNLQWLRAIAVAATCDGMLEGLSASDIATLCDEHDIEIPGTKSDYTEPREARMGRILARLFRGANSDAITVDNFVVTRHVTDEYNPIKRMSVPRKTYTVSRAI